MKRTSSSSCVCSLSNSRQHRFEIRRGWIYIDDIRRHISAATLHLFDFVGVRREDFVSRCIRADPIETPALVVDAQCRKFSANLGLVVKCAVLLRGSEELP